MKKIIATISFFVGMSFAASAHAATAVQYDDIAPGSSKSVSQAACAPLGTSVSLTTSAGVSASYRCSEAYNSILVGTCHSGGSAKPQTVTCNCATTGDPGLDVTDCDGLGTMGAWNDATCSLTVPPMTFETAARQGFKASSGGGTISGVDLGEAVPCDIAATRVIVTQ